MSTATAVLAASPVELELLRAERRSVVADTLPMADSLADYDAARASLAPLSDADLLAVIHCESGRCSHDGHQHRAAPLARRSVSYVAAVDIERERRKYQALARRPIHRLHTADDPAEVKWNAPTSGVSTDHYREHLDKWCQRATGCGLAATRERSGAHIGTAHRPMCAEDERQRELGQRRRNPAAYDIWCHTGGAQMDGGAYAIATHAVEVDHLGRETLHKVPTLVYVAAVAQPDQVQAKRRKSTTWRGASAASDSQRLADVGHSPRQHAEADTFYVDTDEGERGYNGRHNGEPIRWQALTAEGAEWLHAVAGTRWQAPTGDSNDPRRVVGAVAIDPTASRTHLAVAVDYVDQAGETRTYVRTRPLDHHGRADGPADVIVGSLPHTARIKRSREDLRTRQRNVGERGQAVVEATRQRRLRESCQLAATALATGEPIRSNSRPARAVRAATAVAVMAAIGGQSVSIGTLLTSVE